MLEEDHLASMAHNAGYKDKVIIRKVVIDDYDSFRDFEGHKVSSDEFSARFSIKVTPTLVFVDHKGNPVAKRMLGYNRSDFYSVYLDEAIEKAKTQIQ
jgi:thioredoxin-related protein